MQELLGLLDVLIIIGIPLAIFITVRWYRGRT